MNADASVVVFRADASASLGAGHIMRCLALASAMKKEGWRCIFATRTDSFRIVPALLEADFELINLLTETEANEIAVTLDKNASLLVVDHYHLDKEFHTQCREWSDKILVIDELMNRKFDCDFLLDQSPGRDKSDYAGRIPDECELLCGPDYALLRTEFSALRDESHDSRNIRTSIGKILINFGAVDERNLCGRAVDALESINHPAEIHLVAGSGSVHFDKLKQRIGEGRCNIVLHTQVDDMAGLMKGQDLAIGAAGISSWERCCLGLPAIVIIDAENQRLNALGLQRAKAAVVLGDSDSVNKKIIADAVLRLERDSEKLNEMSVAASGLCDGRGTQRVIRELMN